MAILINRITYLMMGIFFAVTVCILQCVQAQKFSIDPSAHEDEIGDAVITRMRQTLKDPMLTLLSSSEYTDKKQFQQCLDDVEQALKRFKSDIADITGHPAIASSTPTSVSPAIVPAAAPITPVDTPVPAVEQSSVVTTPVPGPDVVTPSVATEPAQAAETPAVVQSEAMMPSNQQESQAVQPSVQVAIDVEEQPTAPESSNTITE